MGRLFTFLFTFLFPLATLGQQPEWRTERHTAYTYHFKNPDAHMFKLIRSATAHALNKQERTFHGTYANHFDIFIHDDRHSLDSTWQHDWKMPDLKTECWEVASGVARRLDILDPATWSRQACDHDPTDELATDRIVAHELIHVYHGQHNPSPDFSDVQGLDWFVEGLATFFSGQLDDQRTKQAKDSLLADRYPRKLDDFWKGPQRYGWSGMMVKYIDQRYGRDTIIALLPCTRKEQVLANLAISEEDLIHAWKEWGSK